MVYHLLCPDGCCDEDNQPRDFRNAQSLRLHLFHLQGINGHPKRTMDDIERAIFNSNVMPDPNAGKTGSSSIDIENKRK